MDKYYVRMICVCVFPWQDQLVKRANVIGSLNSSATTTHSLFSLDKLSMVCLYIHGRKKANAHIQKRTVNYTKH